MCFDAFTELNKKKRKFDIPSNMDLYGALHDLPADKHCHRHGAARDLSETLRLSAALLC
jgi:hypothetical protein